jgi:xanthine dehydrogenase accessory factor
LKHNLPVEAQLTPLLPLVERERTAGRPFALAVVVRTSGSTYRKPGALMVIAADGSYAGLLSGGCLETDLREHARSVIATGEPRTVTYNTGGSDDALWGLGVGCEGAMSILLLRVGAEGGWEPLDHLAAALSAHRRTAVGVVVESRSGGLPDGLVLLPDRPSKIAPPLDAAVAELLERVARSGLTEWLDSGALRLFALPLALPPRLLLLGGGPDALPIVDLAVRLAWKVTVYDHRPSYARSDHFPLAERVVLARPEELAGTLDLGAYEAAVVMSHHLPSDLEYLRALAAGPTGYVGLLGPPHRRNRLLDDLGTAKDGLRGRLRAPVGLELGGRTPESIALSVVAQIHEYLHRPGGPLGDRSAP